MWKHHVSLLSQSFRARIFITANQCCLHQLVSSSVHIIISTDEDPSLRIKTSTIINFRGVSTKLYFNLKITMQAYKELIIKRPYNMLKKQNPYKSFLLTFIPPANSPSISTRDSNRQRSIQEITFQ